VALLGAIEGLGHRFIGVDPYDEEGDDDDDIQHESQRQLLGYIRTLAPATDTSTNSAYTYTVQVPPRKAQPARTAQVSLSWAKVELAVPAYLPPEVRAKGPLTVWIVRVFEPNPPPNVKPKVALLGRAARKWPSEGPFRGWAIEWILLTSLPVLTLADAKQIVAYLAPRKGHL